MLGFTPFKKHANKFNYIPRYFDPRKEARNERRKELRGESAENLDNEYRPGQYVRTQREARAAHRAEKSANSGQQKIIKLVMVAVVLLLLFYLMLPRFMDFFLGQTAAPRQVTVEAPAAEKTPRDAFDQSQISDQEWQEKGIVVVPNDYVE